MTAHIYNALTGETIVRELTEEEQSIVDSVKAEFEAEAAALSAKKETRSAALAKLGLTADEVSALFS
jgi:hypothetical protein